ncbi:Uncharacterised protein [Vibrio cholerae]|nr:Uncharacterised protein [Vibrio cholerae]
MGRPEIALCSRWFAGRSPDESTTQYGDLIRYSGKKCRSPGRTRFR